MRNPILVALDVPTTERALELAGELGSVVGGFKIGSELFTSAGPEIVRRLRAFDRTIFLDLKFHDIPHTVAKAVEAATRLDVQLLTVHTGGGLEMMRVAEAAAQQAAAQCGRPAPVVLGVTVLTSMEGRTLAEVGSDDDVERQVERLAKLAMQAGLRGLVCSPLEISALRRILPEKVQLVTPGIRTATEVQVQFMKGAGTARPRSGGCPAPKNGDEPSPPRPLQLHESAAAEVGDDQRRTLSAKEAIAAGADWLVIGRPIYGAAEPRVAAQAILASLA